jgi:hypothetical protein
MPVGLATGSIGYVTAYAVQDFEAVPVGPLTVFPGPLQVSAEAEIYEKTPSDKTLIMAVRSWMLYPFVAPNWVDLRIGFFLSLTKATADDDVTGLADLVNPGYPDSYYYIGIKTNNTLLPATAGTNRFIGFTNLREFYSGNSRLSSSDLATGTTNANYWRPNNELDPNKVFFVLEGQSPRAAGGNGLQQHFPQVTAAAGGYAVLLGMQILRSSPSSNLVTLKIKSTAQSADMLYSDVPTRDLLISSLQNFPTSVQQVGPVQLSGMPDALYAYWPFFNSRLRIHSLGLYKAR